jgi:hypothetical protein
MKNRKMKAIIGICCVLALALSACGRTNAEPDSREMQQLQNEIRGLQGELENLRGGNTAGSNQIENNNSANNVESTQRDNNNDGSIQYINNQVNSSRETEIQRWEYLVLEAQVNDMWQRQTVNLELNELGADGWELVSFNFATNGGGSTRHVFILKRTISFNDVPFFVPVPTPPPTPTEPDEYTPIDVRPESW